MKLESSSVEVDRGDLINKENSADRSNLEKEKFLAIIDDLAVTMKIKVGELEQKQREIQADLDMIYENLHSVQDHIQRYRGAL